MNGFAAGRAVEHADRLHRFDPSFLMILCCVCMIDPVGCH